MKPSPLAALLVASALGAQCPGFPYFPPPQPPAASPPGAPAPTAPRAPATPGGPRDVTPGTPGPRTPSAPSAPSTPGPRPGAAAPVPATPGAAPAAAGPRGPATPGAATAAGPGLPRRGIPLTFERSPASLALLELDWDYPIPPHAEGQLTVVQAALPAAEAFAAVADGDPRPLVVLRECTTCVGTDLALLSSTAANERTLLLLQWFHLVKLPPDALRDTHGFRHLFDEKQPSHLFVSLADGSERIELDGRQSQNDLWAALTRTVRAAYGKDPGEPVKELMRLLDEADRVDAEQARAEAAFERALEQHGPKSPAIREARRQRDEAAAKKQALLERQRSLADLGSPTR